LGVENKKGPGGRKAGNSSGHRESPSLRRHREPRGPQGKTRRERKGPKWLRKKSSREKGEGKGGGKQRC